MAWYVIDAEFDGLNPSKIHCLTATDISDEDILTTTDYGKMRKFLTNEDNVLIGHNITRFDIPAFEKILDITVKAVLYDTLALSWYLYPDRARHGLEAWGIDLGIQKPYVSDWEGLSIEEYKHRCEEDVKINLLLWKKQYKYLMNLYGTHKRVLYLLDYISLKMRCARIQEDFGWKVDLEYASLALAEMKAERDYKVAELAAAMPFVPVIEEKIKPKKYLNKKGEVTKLGQQWDDLCVSRGHPPGYDGVISVTKSYDPPNPGSHPQLKQWLTSLGWKPRTFKHDKGREIPQINKENGGGICESIKDLYEIEPRLEVLDGLSILNHRIPLLEGIIESARETGRAKARVSGFTNTMRFKHSELVNLPKVNRPYGDKIRGSLISGKGKILCGSDQSSLEDRIKQHFIYPLDKEYVQSMNTEGFDPHLTVAVLAGMMTQEEADAYKNGDKSKKKIRDIAKNGNYACQYGAGPPRLVVTCGISLDQAKKLHSAYWKMNWAIKAVAEKQVTKLDKENNQMWLYNPVSKMYYSLRTEKDKFSTLVQGTASYVFDKWVEKILDKRGQLTAQFHDEIVLEIKDGNQEKCSDMIKTALNELNEELKLNRELGIDIQYGNRYSEIH